MTSWGPHTVATYARNAGFRDEALHDAVALALTVSAGADHYAHNPISAPGAERRGLWGIRVDEVPDELDVDLFKPDHNAAVARALWVASSGSFGWHPSWISGAAAHVRPMVRATLTGHGIRPRAVSSLPFSDQLAHLLSRANAFGQILDTGQLPGA